jgi:hypothetical protein
MNLCMKNIVLLTVNCICERLEICITYSELYELLQNCGNLEDKIVLEHGSQTWLSTIDLSIQS